MNTVFLKGKGNSAFASILQSALQGNIFLSLHMQELDEFHGVTGNFRPYNMIVTYAGKKLWLSVYVLTYSFVHSLSL